MVNVVFVAPYFGANILNCLNAILSLEDVKLGVIAQQPIEALPPAFREKISGHFQVPNSLDPDHLVLAARSFQKEWGQVDRLLGYLEQMQIPLAQARQRLRIPGMQVASARAFRDKNLMKKVLGEAGLPVARQARIESAADARAFVERVGFPVILKPLDGLGAKDTFRATDEGQLFAALNQLLPSAQNPIQGEEFVTGSEHTFETACIRGKPVWFSSTYYLPGPLKVVENPYLQYCVLLPRERMEERVKPFLDLNASALEALGLGTGLSHMEWFLTPDGRRVISEVAARPPGVNIMAMNGIAHGVDFWEKWARLMVHETWDMPERKWAVGCAFLRGHGRGRTVASVEGLEEAIESLGDQVVQARLPKVGMPRSTHYEGEGFVIVRHEETKGAVAALRHLVTSVKLHYR